MNGSFYFLMKKLNAFVIFIFFAFVILPSASKGQVEAKVYAGFNDLLGISGEYLLPANQSLELGVSYRPISRNLFFDWHNIERKSNAFVNLVYKHFARKEYTGFHYGLYLRYWQRNNYYFTDPENETVKMFTSNGIPYTIRTRNEKYSLGTVIGWKAGEKVVVDFNFGLGWAFKFTETTELSNGTIVTDDVPEDAWIGRAHFMSLMGTIALGYRFGLVPVKAAPVSN